MACRDREGRGGVSAPVGRAPTVPTLAGGTRNELLVRRDLFRDGRRPARGEADRRDGDAGPAPTRLLPPSQGLARARSGAGRRAGRLLEPTAECDGLARDDCGGLGW